MDLGIAGKWAQVCGASRGLGFGCAQALLHEGVNVLIVARGEVALEQATAQLRADPQRGRMRAGITSAQHATTSADHRHVDKLATDVVAWAIADA
jgi:3-oxoacyl-[acyl-carrier protein] reductase